MSQVASSSDDNKPVRRTRSCSPVINTFRPMSKPKRLHKKQLKNLVRQENNASVENISDYCQGGYMPVVIGQILGIKSNYKVIRKLGWGQYSTVWMAKNLTEHKKYYALKICKSDKRYRMIALEEVEMLRYIRNCDPHALGFNNIITFYDWFSTCSYHGEHYCLTFELLGPSLLHLIIQSNYTGLEEEGVKNIIKQILLGLVYLHDTCNVIHTDIKPENILICVKKSYIKNMIQYVDRFQKLRVELPRTYVTAQRWKDFVQLYGSKSETYQKPIEIEEPYPEFAQEHIQRATSCPTTRQEKSVKTKTKVEKTPDNKLFVDPNIQIKIADLGNSCKQTRTIAATIQTVQYRSLEVILGAQYSYPVDIWSVACVAFELCTGNYLFNPESTEFLSTAESHLALIWKMLGEIPGDIAVGGSKSLDYFHPSGNFQKINHDELTCIKIEDILTRSFDWSNKKARVFADFMEKMLSPRPSQRMTAANALKHKWLED